MTGQDIDLTPYLDLLEECAQRGCTVSMEEHAGACMQAIQWIGSQPTRGSFKVFEIDASLYGTPTHRKRCIFTNFALPGRVALQSPSLPAPSPPAPLPTAFPAPPPVPKPLPATGDECAICLVSMDPSDTMTVPCGHKFHQSCFLEHVSRAGYTGKGTSCPLCRHEVVAPPPSSKPTIGAQDSSEDDMEEVEESRCIYADCQGVQGNFKVIGCAGTGCSVWAHSRCVRRNLPNGDNRPLGRAYCESCLTLSPELEDQEHICLNPSDERAEKYAAEVNDDSSDSDTSVMNDKRASIMADLRSTKEARKIRAKARANSKESGGPSYKRL